MKKSEWLLFLKADFPISACKELFIQGTLFLKWMWSLHATQIYRQTHFCSFSASILCLASKEKNIFLQCSV